MNKMAAQYFSYFDSKFWENPYFSPHEKLSKKTVWLLVICMENSREKSCSN